MGDKRVTPTQGADNRVISQPYLVRSVSSRGVSAAQDVSPSLRSETDFRRKGV